MEYILLSISIVILLLKLKTIPLILVSSSNSIQTNEILEELELYFSKEQIRKIFYSSAVFVCSIYSLFYLFTILILKESGNIVYLMGLLIIANSSFALWQLIKGVDGVPIKSPFYDKVSYILSVVYVGYFTAYYSLSLFYW